MIDSAGHFRGRSAQLGYGRLVCPAACVAYSLRPRCRDLWRPVGTVTVVSDRNRRQAPREAPGDVPADHHRWMRRAGELAARCPESMSAFAVGAVIVGADGLVLAEGYSRDDDPFVHAEESALRKVEGDHRLAAATLYTTLEPCTKRASRPDHRGPHPPRGDRLARARHLRDLRGHRPPDRRRRRRARAARVRPDRPRRQRPPLPAPRLAGGGRRPTCGSTSPGRRSGPRTWSGTVWAA